MVTRFLKYFLNLGVQVFLWNFKADLGIHSFALVALSKRVPIANRSHRSLQKERWEKITLVVLYERSIYSF